MPLGAPVLTHFADLIVTVGVPLDMGVTPRGRRRLIPITGGKATGHDWHAAVLPGGADHQLLAHDALADLDARYVLETDAGDLIYVQNTAVRCGTQEVMARLARGELVDPELVYFRCTPRFETASASLAWINERLFIGTGARYPDRVEMAFFTVL
jgi:hypothetical protein